MISSLFYVLFFIPVWVILYVRKLITGKSMWIWDDVLLAYGRTMSVHYFNSKSYFLRQMGLLPYVFDDQMDLVGVSIRNPEDSLLRESPIWKAKPGIFHLWFIRSSLRIAHQGRDEVDIEYLEHKSLSYDLLLILKTIPALLFHFEGAVEETQVDLLGVHFYNIDMKQALGMIDERISSNMTENVFFINADCLNKTVSDPEYKQILQSTDLVFPDGSGINLACNMIGKPLKGNINGTDMFPLLCELAQEKGYKLFFLGAKPGIVEKMAGLLLTKYPELNICGYRNGYFDWQSQSQEVVQEINQSGADILFVAFGAPLQEKWIQMNAPSLNTRINLGVGGLFDFYSDNIPRAPRWMRDLGIEWVYRLIQEPRRMWKRYILGNPLFLYRVYRWNRTQRKR